MTIRPKTLLESTCSMDKFDEFNIVLFKDNTIGISLYNSEGTHRVVLSKADTKKLAEVLNKTIRIK